MGRCWARLLEGPPAPPARPLAASPSGTQAGCLATCQHQAAGDGHGVSQDSGSLPALRGPGQGRSLVLAPAQPLPPGPTRFEQPPGCPACPHTLGPPPAAGPPETPRRPMNSGPLCRGEPCGHGRHLVGRRPAPSLVLEVVTPQTTAAGSPTCFRANKLRLRENSRRSPEDLPRRGRRCGRGPELQEEPHFLQGPTRGM